MIFIKYYKKYEFILILFFYFVLYLFTRHIPVHPDEAYYWQWSNYLDFSYYDQGPGIAIYIYFLKQLVGDNLRLIGIISNLLAFLFFSLYSHFIFQKFGLKLSIIRLFLFFISIPALLGISFMTFHDSLLLICWNASIFYFLKSFDYLKKHNTIHFTYYTLLILFLGLGTLTKYTMIHFIISLILFLLLKSNRNLFFKILRDFRFYIGIFIYLILILPILYWNYHHNWIGIDAIKYLRSSGGGFQSFSLHKYLLSFFFSLSPFYFFYLIVNINKIKKFYEENDSIRFLVINVVFVVIFFFVYSLSKEVQGNWIIMIYPVLSFLIYLMFELHIKRKFLYISMSIFCTIGFFNYIHNSSSRFFK
ncbi:MAG: hypothetical protein KatS3mg129_0630 [Leptospiraceae bacterium]|nr:MAG: hypothetical protein KatS3mg129_0630 [Leptospiraceae bacterium]